jgi:hypothetical protein
MMKHDDFSKELKLDVTVDGQAYIRVYIPRFLVELRNQIVMEYTSKMINATAAQVLRHFLSCNTERMKHPSIDSQTGIDP